MSDLSMPHCEICKQPEYACTCTRRNNIKDRFTLLVRDFIDELDDPGVFRADIGGLYETAEAIVDDAMVHLDAVINHE